MHALSRALGSALMLCLISVSVMPNSAQAQALVIESWRKDDQSYWDEVLIPAFQLKHPGIRLKFAPEEPLSYDPRLDARLANGRAGDLVFCRPFDAGMRLNAREHLQPLTELQLVNFDAHARRAWTSDDGKTTYCMPVAHVIHGILYNKQIFKDLQLEPPDTTAEFMALLQKVSAAGKVTPLALGTADMWESNHVIFTGLGPNFWQGEKSRLALISGDKKFTDPEFLRVWRMMGQLKPYMHPKQSEMSNHDIQILFATGHAAVYPTGSWDIDLMRNTSFPYRKKIDMGVFKAPLESAGQRCHLSVQPEFGIGINKNTMYPEAAQLFVDWLASAEFAQLLTNTMSG